MKALGKSIGLAGLLLGLAAGAASAAETVLDRQGGWEVVQSDGEGAAELFLAKVSDGSRTRLATAEVPTATVTNSYWDEYAGWDESTGRPVGGMVTRVDTVAAEYRFRAFVNDNHVYWEDRADGVARLWTAPCGLPEGKTLLAEVPADGTGDVFGAQAWRRGAMWREAEADGMGEETMVFENGQTRQATVRERSAAMRGRAAKGAASSDYAERDGDDFRRSHDYRGSMPGYDFQTLSFDANGGRFEDGSTVLDGADYGLDYPLSGTGVYRYWYTGNFQFPSREGHAFNGWYSAAAGGTRVKEGDPVGGNLTRTVYAHWVPTSGTSLAEALDCGKLAFTTGGTVPWFGQKATSHDGSDAARSGQLPPACSAGTGFSVLSTTVQGPGTISFQWMADSSDGRSLDDGWGEGETVMEFLVDGTAKAALKERQTGWRRERVDIGDGPHALKWKYTHEHIGSCQGLDCGYVDQVEWTRPEKQTVTFDANGGSCGTATAVYSYDGSYGSLPTATRGGHAFAGWFTDAGAWVTETSRVEGGASLTLHARWAQFTDGVALADQSVRQRFPWNGLVDIDYEVFCEAPDTEVWVYPEAFDGEHDRSLVAVTLSGDGAHAPIRAGRHRMTWDAKAENPNAHSSMLTVKMKGSKSKRVGQTISFTPIGEQIVTNSVQLSATASSGEAVVFVVGSGPGKIEGNMLTFTGAGTVEVRAVQAGDEQWLPATATQTVMVAKAKQTISFAAIGTQLPTNRVELAATATSGLAVTFEVMSGPGVVTGNVLTFTGEGTVEVRAVQAGDERWLPATATQRVVVEKVYYLVVDLSAGADAASYPVTELDAPPAGGFNTDEYKTTKLVLRRIEPGTFMMGSTIYDDDNPLHQVTLTKPYYMGVFEVTQKQWELVTGGNPSRYTGEKRPVEQVSWNMIRGNSGTYNWPGSTAVNANSFMGRLRARTGLEFDLPTEAQWEYACRAGTTTDLNNGKNLTNSWETNPWDRDSAMDEVGRYADNRSDGKGGYTDAHTTVGSYLPNSWGLYDMHGNVWEWCLDWHGSLTGGVTDPVGSSSGSCRVRRGGSWDYSAVCCSSSFRHYYYPSDEFFDFGFRLVRTLSNAKSSQTISFAAIGPQTPADRVTLSATATSGLAVTFEVVSGPGVVTGNVLTFTGAGTVEVRAVQTGDERWLPATATQTVAVAKLEQTIDIAAIGDQTWQDRVELSATATSGLAVTFEVVSGPGMVTGNVLTFTGEGTVEVRAVQTGDERWLPATATQTVAVAKAAQTISFTAIGAQLATNRVTLSATATSGLAVTFEVMSGPGVVTGNVLTFTGAGTVEVRAVQAGDERWLPASATQTVAVAKAAQTIDFAAIGAQTTADLVELSATATSGLSVTFEVVSGPGVVTGNVLAFTGAGTVEVRALQAGDERWLPATATQTVAVAKAAQTIDFAAIGAQTTADLVELSATATSGLSVTFEVVSGPGVVTGNELTFTGAGTVEVRAVQAGNERWLPATATQTVFVVTHESDLTYMVVDLSAGSGEGASYPVSYLVAVPEGGWTDEYKTTKLVLRRIEPGTFMMGSPTSESGRETNETQHKVTLSKPYYIGLFEVTQKQYLLVMGSNPSNYSGDKRPVEVVSWDTIRGDSGWPSSSAVSADSFMGRIRARTGLGDFDLPTEAQWEYACRAGTTTSYSYGNTADGNYMWYSSPTHDVGTKQPNPWGLYDMHGNVWEWCLDWVDYLSDLGTEAVTDPKGASSGSFRSRRGGSWRSSAARCRSAYRGYYTPSSTDNALGFRPICSCE